MDLLKLVQIFSRRYAFPIFCSQIWPHYSPAPFVPLPTIWNRIFSISGDLQQFHLRRFQFTSSRLFYHSWQNMHKPDAQTTGYNSLLLLVHYNKGRPAWRVTGLKKMIFRCYSSLLLEIRQIISEIGQMTNSFCGIIQKRLDVSPRQ